MSMSSARPRVDEHDAHITVEVIGGVQLMSPRPAVPHSVVAMLLGSSLHHRFYRKSGGPPDRPGGWIILPEPELRLDDDTLAPDLAGWRRERWPLLRREEAAAVRVAPDFVCEVLSGSTEKTDRQIKLPAYHRHGVKHLWLVHPVLQTIEVFRHSPAGFVLIDCYCDGDIMRAEPFESVDLPLTEVWPQDEFAPSIPPAP
ncbi:MAG: Uma2 family endonuclease [Deltaproteobacteria bacterium]|jgi:Uma2 family endonuclease|nr:Uma2 family endonuclease [Deltaproteobacteria bacterium]